MQSRLYNDSVVVASSAEEIRAAVSAWERRSLGSLLMCAYIRIFVTVANVVLALLRLLLFKRTGYRRTEFQQIVVYTVGILGDNAVLLPALAALRRRYRAARITVITNCQIWSCAPAKALFERSPFVDRFLIVDDDLVKRAGWRLRLDRTQVPDVSCDLFVNLSPFGNRGWFGAVLREMGLASVLGATHAVGFKMHTRRTRASMLPVQHRFVQNEPRRSASVLRRLGIRVAEDEDVLPKSSAARTSVLRKLGAIGWRGQPIAIIHPGAKSEFKCWPPERFGDVGRWMAGVLGMWVVVSGNDADRNVADRVVAAADGAATSLAGETDLGELIELLRLANVCVTNDTGTMHLASMLDVPTAAVFSMRITPAHWFPLGSRTAAVFRLVECSLCYQDYTKDTCSHLRCLREIAVNDVVEALERARQQQRADAPASAVLGVAPARVCCARG